METFLGYIEYSSHFLDGLDSPITLTFLHSISEVQLTTATGVRQGFTMPVEPMSPEPRGFLLE
jgi:hypothetical protein